MAHTYCHIWCTRWSDIAWLHSVIWLHRALATSVTSLHHWSKGLKLISLFIFLSWVEHGHALIVLGKSTVSFLAVNLMKRLAQANFENKKIRKRHYPNNAKVNFLFQTVYQLTNWRNWFNSHKYRVKFKKKKNPSFLLVIELSKKEILLDRMSTQLKIPIGTDDYIHS